jgi:hypothetical protein
VACQLISDFLLFSISLRKNDVRSLGTGIGCALRQMFLGPGGTALPRGRDYAPWDGRAPRLCSCGP